MYNQSQIASFLTVYMMRNITLNELIGFRDALLELCISIDLKDFERRRSTRHNRKIYRLNFHNF